MSAAFEKSPNQLLSNRLLNEFEQMQGMMKKMKGSGMMKMMKRMGGMKGMPKF